VNRTKRLLVFSAIGLLLVAALFIAFSSLNAYREMLKIRTGSPWRIPSRIYSRELIISPGTDISRVALMERLTTLRYRKVERVNSPGEYSASNDSILIFLHSFEYPEGILPADKIRLTLNGRQVERIVSSGSKTGLPEMRLEPECIAQIFDAGYEDREIVSLKDCPTHFLDALLCVEDRRFYDHSGIDMRSMVRALLADVYQGQVVEGGSTITQQLVKNLFLTHERTYTRKLKEIWLSLIMETAFTKDEILGMYVNEVYLGRLGYAGIHGFGRAARLFFDKDLPIIELHEAALLAGLVRSPNRYSPYTHPSLALSRRNTVLEIMWKEGKITREAYEKALRMPLMVVPLNPSLRQAPYFIDYVLSSIHDVYPEDAFLSRGGLRIFTTLDMHMQRTTEQVLAHGMDSFNRDIEVASVIVDPTDGEIMAMVGGRSYGRSQFNRATSIHRSIGSLVKPIIYYHALKKGYTLASSIEDSKLSVPLRGNAAWSPSNFDGSTHGQVMLVDALANSYNLATVRLGLSLGMDEVRSEISAVLPRAQVRQHPSILLGSLDCSPLDVALMYATFANGGFKVKTQCIRTIVDEHGATIWKAQGETFPRILDQNATYLLDTALIETLKRGTGRAAQSYGVPGGVCGKTGTTNDLRDSWFAAYTQDLALVVWLGNDSFKPIGFTGAAGALPLASQILAQLADPMPRKVPDDITFCSIDPVNGKRATNWTTAPVEMPFLKGTEPQEISEEGMPKIWKILKSIFPFGS
jgi:penicillin-binding protein 1B